MPIEFRKWIYRADLQREPEARFVFGDNVERVGLGGQAREMRGEPNAIGVVTKFKPTMELDAFFNDGPRCHALVSQDLLKVEQALQEGRLVVIPADGLGSGLARLPERAPKLNAAIAAFIEGRAAFYSQKQSA